MNLGKRNEGRIKPKTLSPHSQDCSGHQATKPLVLPLARMRRISHKEALSVEPLRTSQTMRFRQVLGFSTLEETLWCFTVTLDP